MVRRATVQEIVPNLTREKVELKEVEAVSLVKENPLRGKREMMESLSTFLRLSLDGESQLLQRKASLTKMDQLRLLMVVGEIDLLII